MFYSLTFLEDMNKEEIDLIINKLSDAFAEIPFSIMHGMTSLFFIFVDDSKIENPNFIPEKIEKFGTDNNIGYLMKELDFNNNEPPMFVIGSNDYYKKLEKFFVGNGVSPESFSKCFK